MVSSWSCAGVDGKSKAVRGICRRVARTEPVVWRDGLYGMIAEEME